MLLFFWLLLSLYCFCHNLFRNFNSYKVWIILNCLVLPLAYEPFQFFFIFSLDDFHQLLISHFKKLKFSKNFQILRLVFIKIFFIPLPFSQNAFSENSHTFSKRKNKISQAINFTLVWLISALIAWHIKRYYLLLLILSDHAKLDLNRCFDDFLKTVFLSLICHVSLSFCYLVKIFGKENTYLLANLFLTLWHPIDRRYQSSLYK